LLLCALTSACAHYPRNDPLQSYRALQGYRFDALRDGDNTDSLFLCLALSGGGTRAAALAYGVMRRLDEVTITWKGKERRLLDEIDCISSVSGGSFTAAYYALFGRRLFQDFRARFLDRDVQQTLFHRLFYPGNLVRVLSPYFGPIDLAAEYYGETVFEDRTFGDLVASGRRPFIMVNATNLANGERFDFTQDQFDLLGSDLATFPVARAVAASSAFPILLSPVSLFNHPQPPGFTLPDEYKVAEQDYFLNRRRYQWARNRLSFLDKPGRPYVHLMDGGLADNIGLRAIDSAYRRGFIRHRLNDGLIEKLVLVVVNARTEAQDEVMRMESPPSLAFVAYKTATISMDNYSFETIEMVRELKAERVKAQQVVAACQKQLADRCPGAPGLPTFAVAVDPYVIELNFEMISDPQRRRYFLELPTTFALPRAAVNDLIAIGGELLDRSPEFQEFLMGVAPKR
jgi:NTE family protein